MSSSPKYAGLFCKTPFEFATIDVSGNVNLCCQGWLPQSIGNVLDQPFAEIWNSTEAQAIRASIHDGTFKYCTAVCPYLIGDLKGRISRKEDVQDPFLRRVIDGRQTQLTQGPVELLPAYDATCNVACPGCRTEVIAFSGEQRRYADRIHQAMMEQALENASLLIFSGQGDPFASPIYRGVLRSMDKDLFPGMRIGIITNALLFNEAMWASMAATQHRIVFFHVSVNAANPATFNHVQGGGDFARFKENLAFIAALRRTGAIPFLRLAFYVAAHNFREMADFVRLAKEHDADEAEFSLLLNAGSYTDEEYAALAVHEPSHADHTAFIAQLHDPIFEDPRVIVGNLLPFFPKGYSEVTKLRKSIPVPAFAEQLGLAPETCAELIKIINDAKDTFAALAQIQTTDDTPSPAMFLAARLAAGAPDALPQLLGYLRTHRDAETSTSYVESMDKINRRAQAAVHQLLDPRQRAAWEELGTATVFDIDTGHDPFGAAVGHLMSSAPATHSA